MSGDTKKTIIMEELVAHLYSQSIIHDTRVVETMASVDRYYYCSKNAYADSSQNIGFGSYISAPHIHSQALEALIDKIIPGENILDVGSGSGYLTACMGMLLGDSGLAVGVDHIPELVKQASRNVLRGNEHLIKNSRVKFVLGDGRYSVPEFGPYNAIFVGASTTEIPQILLQDLKVGGRLLIAIGPPDLFQTLTQVDKVGDDKLVQEELGSVKFLPLTDREEQWPVSLYSSDSAFT